MTSSRSIPSDHSSLTCLLHTASTGRRTVTVHRLPCAAKRKRYGDDEEEEEEAADEDDAEEEEEEEEEEDEE